MKWFLISILILILFFLIYKYIQIEDYDNESYIISDLKNKLALINPEFLKIPIKEGNGSYTENKTFITLCTRKNGKVYDSNTLIYVCLHEIAHLISKSYGHNQEFRDNFKMLLDKAQSLGLYNKNIPIPEDYCGIE